MTNRILKTCLSAALAGAGALSMATASAQDQEFVFQVADNTLDSRVGVQQTYARLAYEARRYCESLDHDSVSGSAEIRMCTRDVVEYAIRQIRNEDLSQHHTQLNRTENRPVMTASNGG